jgi:8-oxo-dGTP diphosphatase
MTSTHDTNTASEAEPESAALAADVVVFGERDGELHALVIRRGWEPYKGAWALPGGYVDAGEDVAETAPRELFEETGLTVGALALVGVYADPGRDPRGRIVTWAYTARVPGLPPAVANDGELDAQWMPVKDLLRDPQRLAFDHGRILRDALRHVL